MVMKHCCWTRMFALQGSEKNLDSHIFISYASIGKTFLKSQSPCFWGG